MAEPAKRKKVWVDGGEVDAPADMSVEQIRASSMIGVRGEGRILQRGRKQSLGGPVGDLPGLGHPQSGEGERQ